MEVTPCLLVANMGAVAPLAADTGGGEGLVASGGDPVGP